MNRTNLEVCDCTVVCWQKAVDQCCAYAKLAWLLLWFVPVAASPIAWCYTANHGPEWFTSIGWAKESVGQEVPNVRINGRPVLVANGEQRECMHLPSVFSCVLFDILFLAIGLAPITNCFRGWE